MRSWLVRSVLVLGAVALVVWPEASPRPRASRPHDVAMTSSFAFASAVPSRPPDLLTAGDGGVLAGDGSTVEPVPATGRIAGEIVMRLCPEAAQILCHARDRLGCGPLTLSWNEADHELPASCVENVHDRCRDWVERHYAGFDDDLVIGDHALARCLGALREDSLEPTLLALGASCGELAVEAVREGEPCTTAWTHCEDDTLCMHGRCTAQPERGEPCLEDCCTTGLGCVDGICVAPTPIGGPCDAETTCGGFGAFCVDGRCATSLPDGELCGYDAECAFASRCERGRCVRASTSVCSLEGDCGNGRFCAGDFAAHCEPIPRLGDACTSAFECEPWLDCIEGQCGRLRPGGHGPARIGDACEVVGNTDECARGLVCRFGEDGYRCRVGGAVGDPCESQACAAELLCVWRVVDGRCAPAFCGTNDYFAEQNEE